jgi:hypothetical protein
LSFFFKFQSIFFFQFGSTFSPDHFGPSFFISAPFYSFIIVAIAATAAAAAA